MYKIGDKVRAVSEIIYSSGRKVFKDSLGKVTMIFHGEHCFITWDNIPFYSFFTDTEDITSINIQNSFDF